MMYVNSTSAAMGPIQGPCALALLTFCSGKAQFSPSHWLIHVYSCCDFFSLEL